MKKYLLSLVILLLPMVLATAQTDISKNAESMLIDAVTDLNDNKIDTALDKLSAIVDADPSNDAAYYYLAECMIARGNAAQAEKFLLEATRLDSSNFWYNEKLAMLYSAQNKVAQAVATYEKMKEAEPKNVDITYELVNLYARQGKMDKVIESLDEIESVMGKSEPITRAKFDVLLRMNKPAEAFAALESFNEDFSSPEILTQMGDFKASEGADSLAMVYYDQALEVESDYPSAVIGKAETYRGMGMASEYFQTLKGFTGNAEINPVPKAAYIQNTIRNYTQDFSRNHRAQIDEMIEDCVEAHPADSSMLRMAGSYYYSTNQYPKAKEKLEMAFDCYPEDIMNALLYTQALSYMEYWEDLKTASDKALGRFPEIYDFYQLKIMAMFNLKDFEGIIQASESMIKAAPKDSAVCLYAYNMIGDSYHEMNNVKKAYKAYDKALKINPDYAPVLNNYAYYLSLEGKNLKKAYAMSKKTIEQEPDNATYLDTFAWILHIQGKDLEAKSIFKHAMLYGGKDSSNILDHYATVLSALGEDSTAKIYKDLAKKKAEEEEEAAR